MEACGTLIGCGWLAGRQLYASGGVALPVVTVGSVVEEGWLSLFVVAELGRQFGGRAWLGGVSKAARRLLEDCWME